jgi:23S rRNA (uracil1939-C5)-methyltransferase
MVTSKNTPDSSSSDLPRPGQEVIVDIGDLAFGGKGVGRIGGIACFVPGVIDGEKVRVRIRKLKSRLLEADLLEVLESSPHRVPAPCPVFLKCGGCNYQHIDYGHQIRIKENQLREALRRLGGVSEPPVTTMVASPEQHGYRNRITVHVKEGVEGFFAEGSNRIVPVDRCLIASEDVNAGLKDLRDSRPRDGDYLIGEKKRYGGFRQVNNSVAGILQSTVTLAVRFDRESDGVGELLIDAYCGAGFFAHVLQSLFIKVIGIERSIGSVAMARRRAESNEEYMEGAVEEMLPAALSNGSSQGTTLILDPPSEGLAIRVTEAILERPPSRIIYVSCDPATLARDVRRLSERYRLVSVTPLDMFPQTAEIESVSLFELLP